MLVWQCTKMWLIANLCLIEVKTCDLMNPLANAKDPRNADVLHSDDADGKDAVAIESNILISYNFTNKHKKAQAANREVFSSNKRSQTVC